MRTGGTRNIRALPATGAAKDGDLGAFQIMVNEDADRLHSFTNYALLRRQWSAQKGAKLVRHEETASRYQYVGGIREACTTRRP